MYAAIVASTEVVIDQLRRMCPSYWTVRFFTSVEALCGCQGEYVPHITVLDLSHRDSMYRAEQLELIRSTFPSASTIGYTCIDSIPKTFVWTECKAMLDAVVLQNDVDGMERAVLRVAGTGATEPLLKALRQELGMGRRVVVAAAVSGE